MDGMLKDEKSDSQDTDKKKGGVEMKPAGGIHRGGDNDDGEDDGGQRKKQLISKAKKTGKERRRERRLRNEPQNFIGLGEGPSRVNPLDFANARAIELKSMLKALESKEGGKRVFQRLPRHMRRRAMSHNPKRLPRRLREAAAREAESESETKKKKKPPCRRKRRKLSSLRQEYSRRQRENKWLETHIWHAKRMKMSDTHGYRLAEYCSDKGIRAAHKSLVHGCLLSDISYYCCNEISGSQSSISACLNPLFTTETGLTVQAKSYLSGQREGKAVLYKPGFYPHGAIAPVHFLWQADVTSEMTPKAHRKTNGQGSATDIKSSHKLWIWCHCAVNNQVLSEIQTLIQSHNKTLESDNSLSELDTQSLKVSVAPRNLNRFRLIGPRSHALLMEVLKPVWDKNEQQKLSNEFISGSSSEESAEEEGDGISDSGNSTAMNIEDVSLPPAEKWWLGELKSQMARHSNVLASQYPAIKLATGPEQFMPGMVMGVCVQDPRFFTPNKRTDMVSSFYPQKEGSVYDHKNEREEIADGGDGERSLSSTLTLPNSIPRDVAFSPIWDSSICKSVSESKIPNHLLNLKRSEKLSSLDYGDAAPQIPVMIIQQTSQCLNSAHLGVGWDLILPPEWGMAFWIALVYRGARACGMRELRKCSLESQVLHFYQDFPDTDAGCRHSVEQRKKLEVKYMKRPPDKRLNYGKLLIPAPFHCPWEDLMRYWSKRCAQNISSKGVKRKLEDIVGSNAVSKKVKFEGNEEDLKESDQPLVVELDRSLGSKIDTKLEPRMIDNKVKLEVSKGDSSCSTNKEPERSLAVETKSGLLFEDCLIDRSFYVLRSRETLNSIKLLLKSVFTRKKRKCEGSNVLQSFFEDYSIESLLKKHSNSLVPVRIEVQSSGNISDLDSLSLPTPSDLQALLTADRFCPFTGPTEEINQRGVTVIEKEAVVVGISSLTRKEMKAIKRSKSKNSLSVNNFQLFPVKPSRLTIGHVTSAGYRLTTSLGSGLGFVAFGGLIENIVRCHSSGATKLLALARGAKTKYYFVKVQVM